MISIFIYQGDHSDLNSVNLVLINAEIQLIKSSFWSFFEQPGSGFEDELTGKKSVSSFPLVVSVFIGRKVMLGSFLLEFNSPTIKLVSNWWITKISSLKSNVKVGVNWNKCFKRLKKNKILLSWLLETRLIFRRTAIEEVHMYTLDGIDTQFTSKWTRFRYCEGDMRGISSNSVGMRENTNQKN